MLATSSRMFVLRNASGSSVLSLVRRTSFPDKSSFPTIGVCAARRHLDSFSPPLHHSSSLRPAFAHSIPYPHVNTCFFLSRCATHRRQIQSTFRKITLHECKWSNFWLETKAIELKVRFVLMVDKGTKFKFLLKNIYCIYIYLNIYASMKITIKSLVKCETAHYKSFCEFM